MIKKYSFEILKPQWPKWKLRLGDFFLNRFTYLGVARVNKLLENYGYLKNQHFIEKVLEEVEVELDLVGLDNVPYSGPVTLVANHPGGADVMATCAAIGRKRDDFVILANELICVEPVVEIVLPVNLMSRNNKVDKELIHEAYKNNKLVIFYAAGNNSRYNEKGELRDRKWRTTFLDFALAYNSPIVVLNIGGGNSPTFYKVSNIRQKYSVFRNIPLENMFQLRELLKSKGLLKLMFSEPISSAYLKDRLKDDDVKSKRQLADELYAFLYSMDKHNLKFNPEEL